MGENKWVIRKRPSGSPLKFSGRYSPSVFKPELAGLFFWPLWTVSCLLFLGETKSSTEGGFALSYAVKMIVVTSKLFDTVYCT